nr:flagellar biosynthetic protein FliR [Sphingomonas colocasiae]
MLGALRIGPVFAFAPPFTLMRIPATIRVLLAIALAASFIASHTATPPRWEIGELLGMAAGELLLGLSMTLALQLGFAAIAVAGRALDIQAGFGFAFLVDPTTKAQTPLIGALFTYATAAIFFATSGPSDLVAVFAASFTQIPVGGFTMSNGIGPMLAFFATVSILGFGTVGIALLVLFLVDLVIAMMSRTLPQMNMLVLGFQVKAMVTLVLLPVTLGLAGGAIMRILRLTTEAMLALG